MIDYSTTMSYSEIMTQSNTKERALEMAKRIVNRLARFGRSRMQGVPANINRHTGEPHLHTRAKARNLKNHVNKDA
jgi:hypothetical protein